MRKFTFIDTGTLDLSLIFDIDQFSIVLLDAYHHEEHSEIWCGLGPLSLVLSYLRRPH
jgi:hypothetical protein